ncbi:MAG: ATP synthase F1 subunit delta [Lachnospirales bacterium]
MAELVAKRYSNALFSIASEENKVETLLKEIETMLDIFKENEDFKFIINHPHMPKEEKIILLKNVFDGKVDENVIGLFQVILSKNRESELVSILEGYVTLAKEHLNITTATIVTAKVLSDEQINKILANISKQLGKTVNYTVEVDEKILGGLKILVDGKVYENTIEKTISDMKKEFYQG